MEVEKQGRKKKRTAKKEERKGNCLRASKDGEDLEGHSKLENVGHEWRS